MKRLLMMVSLLALVCAACGKKDEAPADKPADKPVDVPTDKPADAPDPQQAKVDRGEYLAHIAGCNLCHTPMGKMGPDTSKAYAGGLEVKEAFGTWRSPNITMHEATGIGSWTDEQIIKAVREGVRPDGTGMIPIMPFMFYNAMSDDDAAALVAYLRTVPAVDNKVERVTGLPLPTADKMPVPKPAGKPPGESPAERGRYLATLAHCGACHVPVDKKGVPDMARMYAGGMPMELMEPFGEGVVYAPNLTPDPKTGIADYTEEDLVAAIRTMKKKDGSPIVFPMMLYAPAYGALSDEDASAIAVFIKSLPPVENAVPASKYKLSPMGKPPADGDAPPPESDGPGKGT